MVQFLSQKEQVTLSPGKEDMSQEALAGIISCSPGLWPSVGPADWLTPDVFFFAAAKVPLIF